MATIDLGKIAITPEGKWSAGKYYEKLSLVIFNGQSYLSLRDTTGDNPETSPSDWMQITSRGESLYQMMVREGKFVGTEEEFTQQYLDSLKACADASDEVRSALSDILDEMDRIRAEISEVMVEEDIRIKNEAKRESAEINRKNADITRGVAERNRQEAEQRREQSMQQIQNDAEIALAMAAEAQQKAEEAILNEEERISAENQRKIDEATRIQHEEQRVNDEAMRRSREADRLESENIRQKNEGDRILAEREREETMRNLVEELKGLAANKFKIVDVLPEVGEFAVIYLVPSTTPSDKDVYDEWAYVSEKWERIGSTRFEIDNYYTKEEIEAALNTKQETLTAGNGISIEGNVIGVTAITESESQPDTSLWLNPSEDEETNVTYNRSQIDALHQSIVNSITSLSEAGYVFAGIATPETDPGTPNAKVFYIANGKGTYSNFGGLKVTEDDVVVLYYDTAWHKVATGIASEEKLTELGSEVGKVKEAVNTKNDDVFEIADAEGSVIAIIDKDGLHTTNVETSDSEILGNVKKNELVICDGSGNVILNLSRKGLEVADFVGKSVLKNDWKGKIIATYGDSVTAINNGDWSTPFFFGNPSNAQMWANRVADYFGMAKQYGRGIGGQGYKWTTGAGNGGSVSFINQFGNLVSRNDGYNLDNYTGAIPSGCTAVRGCLSSWLRITTMFPETIKDSIDIILVMAHNDVYDENDCTFVPNDTTDTEWASSGAEYYGKIGGDYNLSTLRGGIASTIMKLQMWIPNAVIVLMSGISGQGVDGRINTDINQEKGLNIAEAIRDMSKMTSIPCIDTYASDGINGWNRTDYISDSIHPYNEKGGKMFSRAVIGGIKSIIPLY